MCTNCMICSFLYTRSNLLLLDGGFLKHVLRGLFFVNRSWFFCANSAIICTIYWHSNRAALDKALKMVIKEQRMVIGI